ncbi:MAG: hypothetical protein HYV53_04385 [Parcubacteria group bacterium]|nr:hypothetical protein [Parcubacteria group bacterium]
MEEEKFYSQSDYELIDISKKAAEEYERLKLEPLSGIETTKLAAKFYEILGPELGCRLAESNIILLMSGMKGYADMPWIKLDKEKMEKLEHANSQLENFGLEIICPKKLEGDSIISGITVVNFKGVERKSKITRIPGVPQYDSKLGKDGLIRWRKEFDSSLKEAQKTGKIPKAVDLEILFEGIIFGYPDQAIIDFEKCLRTGRIHEDLIEADIISSIPEAEKYQGAVPEFDYYPEHKDNPEIVEYISNAKNILNDFYQSDWFKELSQRKEFQESRQEAAQIERAGFLKKN